PHVPITPREIVETAVRCEAAGAAIIHVHVRNLQDESPSTDFRLFEEVVQGLRAETDLIIQISTGGRAGMSYEQRCKRLRLTPEMASLTTGSVNFPNSVYVNTEARTADYRRGGPVLFGGLQRRGGSIPLPGGKKPGEAATAL
ncbi:MAG: 3-keto-5-aminohexanoate cleavage protein, partial [Desulfobacterales bacterium]